MNNFSHCRVAFAGVRSAKFLTFHDSDTNGVGAMSMCRVEGITRLNQNANFTGRGEGGKSALSQAAE